MRRRALPSERVAEYNVEVWWRSLVESARVQDSRSLFSPNALSGGLFTGIIRTPLGAWIFCLLGGVVMSWEFFRVLRERIFGPKPTPADGAQIAGRLRELSQPKPMSSLTVGGDEKPRPKAS
jgi:hypothetical protein